MGMDSTTRNEFSGYQGRLIFVVSKLAFYNPAHPTSLHVDASRLRGLGFILRQQQTNGSWNVVQAGSRFLSDAESRYAMIELECLAAAWAMRNTDNFLRDFHRLSLYGSPPLDPHSKRLLSRQARQSPDFAPSPFHAAIFFLRVVGSWKK